MKKNVCINGRVAFPVEVGQNAIIYHGGDFIFTSLVVEVKEQRPDFVCFETMNSVYKVSLVPTPVEIAKPCQPMRAA